MSAGAPPDRPVAIAVVGDTHGHFAADADGPLLAAHDLALCTGDLPPNHGRGRFDEALRQARDLGRLGVLTVLGNHDGPTGFTGRRFPKSYLTLVDALAGCHVGGARVDRPDLDVSIVGGRPLSCGGPAVRFAVPERADWDLEQWGRDLAERILAAPCSRVVVLAHAGPTGVGTDRAAPWGRDFGGEDGDWGDPDVRIGLDLARAAGRDVQAVVAGHMHDRLQGGGRRRLAARDGDTLLLNAAVVPRVDREGRRAIAVVSLDGPRATARLEWHAPGGAVEVVLSA